MGNVYWYAVTATCAYIAWVTWIRRWTLRPASKDAALLERSITIGVAELAVGIFLSTPLSRATIGWALHAITGQWNLDAFVGDCCMVSCIGGIGLSVFSRIGLPPDVLRAQFKQHVERPMTVTFPAALALFWQSPNIKQYWPDFFDAPTDVWLDCYWTLMCALTIWMLGRLTWALLGLRRDPRNRPIACLYCAASVMGILLCLARIITTWEDMPYKTLNWWSYCIIAALFGYSARRAWKKKVNWLAGDRRL